VRQGKVAGVTIRGESPRFLCSGIRGAERDPNANTTKLERRGKMWKGQAWKVPSAGYRVTFGTLDMKKESPFELRKRGVLAGGRDSGAGIEASVVFPR